MLSVVLTLANLAAALSLSATSQLHSRAGAPSVPAPVAFWSCKNADLRRSGSSAHVGPRDLSNYSWVFEEPIGYGAFEATPVIDTHYTTFIGSTAGGFFAIRRDGSLLWSRRLPGRVMTPMLTNGMLYVATSQGWAFAVDAATGQDVWKRQIAANAGSDAWSITVSNGTVVLPALAELDDGNSMVYGLDARDGSKRWEFVPDHRVYNFMPAVVDGSFIFMDKTGGIYRVSLADGALMWHVPMTTGSMATGGLAMGPGDLIFATSNQNGMINGTVHAHHIKDGSLKWIRTFDVEAAAAPAMLGPEQGGPAVLVGIGPNCMNKFVNSSGHDGNVVALDPETGDTLWAFAPPTYFGVTARGQERGNGGPTGTYSIPDTWSNPSVGGDGTVYVGWQGGIIFAIEGQTGKEVARHDVGYAFQGESAIAPGYLVVPSLYRVVAFDEGR